MTTVYRESGEQKSLFDTADGPVSVDDLDRMTAEIVDECTFWLSKVLVTELYALAIKHVRVAVRKEISQYNYDAIGSGWIMVKGPLMCVGFATVVLWVGGTS